MSNFDAATVFCVVAAVQTLGLLSAWVARISLKCRTQCICQAVFLACLVLVGGMGLSTLIAGSAAWVISAAVFAVMVLMVTCDFRRAPEVAAW